MNNATPEPNPVQSSTVPQSLQATQVSPAYVPPMLTPLGAWQALTLIISVPIGPGSNVNIPWSGWH